MENSSEKQKITEIITSVREQLQENNFEKLKNLIEELKLEMRNLVAAKSTTDTNSDTDLNDL